MNNLMTRDEMFQRIDNGESRVAISLDKWERIKSYLQENTPEDWYGWFCEHCEGGTCAMCYNQACSTCGMMIDGHTCGSTNHPWNMLRRTGEIEYVDQIIKHLRRLK